MPDKSIREFVRERMHEGNGGRLHLHRLFDATRKAYPRKVVAFSYVQRIATEWFRDGGHLLKEHAGLIPAHVTGVTGDSANMRGKGHAEGPPERAGSEDN